MRRTTRFDEEPDPRFVAQLRPDPDGLALHPVRQLSSWWTFPNKVLLPAVFVLVFLTGPWVAGGSEWLEMLPFFAIFAALLYWANLRLKEVSLRGDVLVISNYLREIEVPLRQVERVTGSVFLRPELVWVHFRQPSGFGNKVIFTPRWRFIAGWDAHPVVAELERLAAQARSAEGRELPPVPGAEPVWQGDRPGR